MCAYFYFFLYPLQSVWMALCLDITCIVDMGQEQIAGLFNWRFVRRMTLKKTCFWIICRSIFDLMFFMCRCVYYMLLFLSVFRVLPNIQMIFTYPRTVNQQLIVSMRVSNKLSIFQFGIDINLQLFTFRRFKKRSWIHYPIIKFGARTWWHVICLRFLLVNFDQSGYWAIDSISFLTKREKRINPGSFWFHLTVL